MAQHDEIKNELRLSDRLEHVLSMIPKGMTVCDVGCDHGFVPIALVSRGISEKVLAMDVVPGPLSSARANIAKRELENKITTRLSDGLSAFEVGDAQFLVIAGMGGPLMLQILSAYPEKTASFEGMVLQPQSKIDEFRLEIERMGFQIRSEDMVEEDGKFYPMMYVEKRNESSSLREETERKRLEDLYGPYLLTEKHPVLARYLEREERILLEILDQMGQNSKNEEKEAEIRERLQKNREAQRLMAE